MTSTVELAGEGAIWPGELKAVRISCDHPGCTLAPTNHEIAPAGGLKAMGWVTKFDNTSRELKHFCPDHISDAEEIQ